MYFRSSSQTKSPVGSSSGDRNGDGGRQNVGGPKQDNQTVSFTTKCHKNRIEKKNSNQKPVKAKEKKSECKQCEADQTTKSNTNRN